jgi:hypothetical protein
MFIAVCFSVGEIFQVDVGDERVEERSSKKTARIGVEISINPALVVVIATARGNCSLRLVPTEKIRINEDILLYEIY